MCTCELLWSTRKFCVVAYVPYADFDNKGLVRMHLLSTDMEEQLKAFNYHTVPIVATATKFHRELVPIKFGVILQSLVQEDWIRFVNM